MQLVVPHAGPEIHVVSIEHLLTGVDVLDGPKFQNVDLVVDVLHGRFATAISVVHRCTRIQEIYGGAVQVMTNPVVHRVIDVPTTLLQLLLAAEFHERAVSDGYTAQPCVGRNVDFRPPAVAGVLDLRRTKLRREIAVETGTFRGFAPGLRILAKVPAGDRRRIRS